MKHLFIINPRASHVKGRIDDIVREIESLFVGSPQFEYHIHITRWKRDASGFAQRYVYNAEKIVRIYAVGGTATLFDVINGVTGLPNVQIAFWPFGKTNLFLRYFEADKRERFHCLRNLIFSGVASFDLIRCGNNYGICFCTIGLEALAALYRYRIIEYAGIFSGISDKSRLAFGTDYGLKGKGEQFYHVVIDDERRSDQYISLLVANQPYYAGDMRPASDAVPDDGLLDLYLVKRPPPLRLFTVMTDYIRGNYHKWPQYISHFRGKRINISSEHVMHINVDGEYFYNTAIDCEVIPHAVDFVCPKTSVPRTTGQGAAFHD
jgi:diacylglycerol kinase family enzyme